MAGSIVLRIQNKKRKTKKINRNQNERQTIFDEKITGHNFNGYDGKVNDNKSAWCRKKNLAYIILFTVLYRRDLHNYEMKTIDRGDNKVNACRHLLIDFIKVDKQQGNQSFDISIYKIAFLRFIPNTF